MDKKKTIAAVALLAVLCGVYFIFDANKQIKNNDNSNEISTTQKDNGDLKNSKKRDIKNIKKNSVKNSEKEEDDNGNTENVKHGNLFNSAPSSFVPLSAIAEITDLPENIKNEVNKVINNYNGILMLKRTKDKVVIIAENPENIRHGIDFVEISVPNGHKIVSTLGYNGKIKDAENDIWEYNQNQLPTKHTKYNKDGYIEFVEVWNYEPDNPIKYEMKNAEGKTLSMRKETLKDGTDMRIEHLLYDLNGNTKVNISTTYEGADIKRFTYYNADKPLEGESIFSEFADGIKTKEVVYSSDLKLQNTLEAHYKDGNRTEVTVLDNNNNKIEEIKAAQE